MLMQEQRMGLLQGEEDLSSEGENVGGVFVNEMSYPRQQYMPVNNMGGDYQSGYDTASSTDWHQQTHNQGDGNTKILMGPPSVYQPPPSNMTRRGRPAASEEENRACRCTSSLANRLGLRVRRGLWCVSDSCGIVCAVFTWMLIAYAEFVVVFVMLIPAPSNNFRWINGLLFHVLSVLALTSHLRAMFSDPGTIALNNATKDNIMRMGFREGQVVYKCPKCLSIKPGRTHHCSICRRCIRKMDHHCPWINNCVGHYNQKYFVLFTLYICLMSFYSIYMAVHYFIICLSTEWEGCSSSTTSMGLHFSPALNTIFILGLVAEGTMFGLFTCIMFCSQAWAIARDETGIENLKKEQPTWEKRSRWLSMETVFGHPCSIRWLLPVSPGHERKEVDFYSV